MTTTTVLSRFTSPLFIVRCRKVGFCVVVQLKWRSNCSNIGLFCIIFARSVFLLKQVKRSWQCMFPSPSPVACQLCTNFAEFHCWCRFTSDSIVLSDFSLLLSISEYLCLSPFFFLSNGKQNSTNAFPFYTFLQFLSGNVFVYCLFLYCQSITSPL